MNQLNQKIAQNKFMILTKPLGEKERDNNQEG